MRPLLMSAGHPCDEAGHLACELVTVVTTCERADRLEVAADREGESGLESAGGGG
ncbi:hypothetical protein [Streptomyces mirabilis]